MVNEISGTEIKCTVIYGGLLGNHKGINLPGVKVSAPSLTEKDKEDAKLALELGVDFWFDWGGGVLGNNAKQFR